MHYKRYCRSTVREALRAVREDLGPDALVLSTRMVPAGGLKGWMGARAVEVTAAIERPAVSEDRIAASVVRQTAAADRALPPASPMAARLEASGVDPALARALTNDPVLQQRAAGPSALRRTLASKFETLTAHNDEPAPVEVFMGPPGVGKTTTIAKIAAQARATRATRFGLVAADGFRVGAVEQLRLYADIIGSPFAVARTGQELSAAIEGVTCPLLIDTAGRSPRDTGAAEIFEALAARPNVRRHLVLPAGTPARDARRMIERFTPIRPDRLVITRLDEVETIAPLLGVLNDCRLPVSYMTNGQDVPDDLIRATPPLLADWVLGETGHEARA